MKNIDEQVLHHKLVIQFLNCLQFPEKIDQLNEIISTSCISHGSCLSIEDKQTLIEFIYYVDVIHNAFSNYKVELLDVIGEHDKICFRFKAEGIHDGNSLFGVPAFGKKINYQSFNIFKIQKHKIIEHWGTSNLYQKLTS